VDVRAFEDAGGGATVILGRGLALRLEVAIEVDAAARGRGLAASALREARRLVAPGEALFAQTSPGNAASLRALLAAGFRPIGGEALFY
jgi:RimJ/RimL family protein N-acetyltransferase